LECFKEQQGIKAAWEWTKDSTQEELFKIIIQMDADITAQ
jgi:hypothetical protein